MESETKKFGRGPRELNGAVDLIDHYKLLAQHDFFCRRTLPVPISETHYLHNVAGDTEIRRGPGMELDQLFETDSSALRETAAAAAIRPFDLDTLRRAFPLREAAPIELPPAERGAPTVSGKAKGEPREKGRKHKKHRDKDRSKDKEHKKHKHRHKDRSSKDRDHRDKDREKKRDKTAHHHDSKKEKKRKHDGGDDVSDGREHKRSKSCRRSPCRPGPWSSPGAEAGRGITPPRSPSP
ncbi:unnamed protein product [Spirodela intermedia]|uniref:Uncharacterized protein n=2 Tax=Spirodela intermedia TaxID=51605 RepID=A0A7I8IWX7_SPIIN|nr:unnamed protein product [Spirodela intermedia]CAA6662494.1 unnamed protein product [Spirodela intermedia]CAA7398893.1 unnamed protein product [Spirodela intermedia]